MRSHRFRDIPSHLSSKAKTDCFSTLVLFKGTFINVRATVRSSTKKTISRYNVKLNYVFWMCFSVCESFLKTEALIFRYKTKRPRHRSCWTLDFFVFLEDVSQFSFSSLKTSSGSSAAILTHSTFPASIGAWKSIRSDSWCSGVPHE